MKKAPRMSSSTNSTKKGPDGLSPNRVGRQLSTALRESLETGDLVLARTLALEGDGIARDLAHEYTQMHRGLGFTVRAVLDQASIQASAATSPSLIRAITRLCDSFDAMQVQSGQHSPEATLQLVRDRAELRLDQVQSDFASDQQRQAKKVVAAIEGSQVELALSLLAQKQSAYRLNHDPMPRFMADIFAWVFEHHGAEGLTAFHMETAGRQRTGFEKWEHLPPAEFAQATAFLLRQHLGDVAMIEDDKKFIIHQSPCGSGGQLRLDGAYNGHDGLPTVEGPAPLTFGEAAMPVYCTHCAIWNGSATIEWFGRPQWVFENPAQPDGSCTLHIYKNRSDIPDDYVTRVSLQAKGSTQ